MRRNSFRAACLISTENLYAWLPSLLTSRYDLATMEKVTLRLVKIVYIVVALTDRGVCPPIWRTTTSETTTEQWTMRVTYCQCFSLPSSQLPYFSEGDKVYQYPFRMFMTRRFRNSLPYLLHTYASRSLCCMTQSYGSSLMQILVLAKPSLYAFGVSLRGAKAPMYDRLVLSSVRSSC